MQRRFDRTHTQFGLAGSRYLRFAPLLTFCLARLPWRGGFVSAAREGWAERRAEIGWKSCVTSETQQYLWNRAPALVDRAATLHEAEQELLFAYCPTFTIISSLNPSFKVIWIGHRFPCSLNQRNFTIQVTPKPHVTTSYQWSYLFTPGRP